MQRVPLVAGARQVGWGLGVDQSALKSNLWGMGGLQWASLLACEFHQWEKSCFSLKETS